jgi:hypothetical protein
MPGQNRAITHPLCLCGEPVRPLTARRNPGEAKFDFEEAGIKVFRASQKNFGRGELWLQKTII